MTRYIIQAEEEDFLESEMWVIRTSTHNSPVMSLNEKKNAVQVGKAIARDKDTKVTVKHKNGKEDTYYFKDGREVEDYEYRAA